MTRRALVAGAVAGVAAAALPAVPASAAAPLLPGARLKPDRALSVAVPGGRVYVRVNGNLGNGKPPIVMLHGGPGSSHWYFLNATALADERAVILYDQLDSGRSEWKDDPANWRVGRFVEELEAVRVALNVPRWHVLGASWGGTVALEYGARQPRELAGLVLQSPLVSTAVWLDDARALKDAMPPAVRDLLDRCDVAGAALQADCDAATDTFYARHVRRYPPPAAIAAYRDALPRSFSAGIYNAMWGRAEFTATGSLRDYDGRPLLQRLDSRRTLFVAGESDEARPATVAAFARAVPGGATFEMVRDAAHSVMNDNPAAYVTLLRHWLAARD
jgi:proline iminopeptidase/L-proline amide hydrolase